MLKHIFRNIKEKKLRTILIVLVIAITTAIFIVNFDVKDNLIKMYTEMYRGMVGDADISITAKSDKDNPFFMEEDINKSGVDLSYEVGVLNLPGKYESSKKGSIKLNLVGVEFEKFNNMNPLILIKEEDVRNFDGSKGIISRKTSEVYGIKLGDEITIKANEKDRKIKIAAIADSKGVFMSELKNITILIPKNTLNSYFDLNNKNNVLYIHLKNQLIDDNIKKLINNNDKFIVEKAISKENRDAQINAVRNSLSVSLAIVLMISFYIIFSSFNVLMAERMPVMGTFRSIGSTKWQTNLLLILESTLYGIIGGFIGIVLGCIGLRVIVDMLNNLKDYGIKTNIEYNFLHLLIGFAFAIAISIFSTLFCILRSNSYSTKDIILNTIQTSHHLPKRRLYIGMLLLIISVSLNMFNKFDTIISILVLILLIGGFICILPFIIGIISRGFEIVTEKISCEASLASKNLRNNRLVINNIVLTTVGLGLIIMISSITSSMELMVNSTEKNIQYDSYIRNFRDSKDTLEKIKNVVGVKETYEDYVESIRLEFGNNEKCLVDIWAIDETEKFFNFYSKQFVFKDNNKVELLKGLQDNRNIILDKHLSDIYKIKKGDTINLVLDNNDSVKWKYKVSGFYDSTILSTKMVGSISIKNLIKDFSITKPFQILVKGNVSRDILTDRLITKLDGSGETVIDVGESLKEQKKNFLDNIFNASKLFVGLAIFMGIFGMVNNFIVSFIQRKRELAVLYSVCMNKKQLRKMILFESAMAASSACILGGVLGILIIGVLPQLLGSIGLVIGISYSKSFILITLIGTFIILSTISIIPMVKTSKMDVIHELKYE